MTEKTGKNELPLPMLREELDLHEGPVSHDGSPTWIIHDPAANRFFSIGYLEFEILLRWKLSLASVIADSVSRETALSVTDEDIENVARFLISNSLVRIHGDQAVKRLVDQAESIKKGFLKWLLTNYLFIRIPLVRPDGFLNYTIDTVKWLWSKPAVIITVISGISGLFLLLRQWESFISTFPFFFNPEGLLLMWITINFAKIIHELGHAYAAKNFGCRVPTMGIAFLVMYPVFYTDASDAWKLPSEKNRMIIGAAGVTAEMAIASYAGLAWSFLPDGPLRSAAFLLASTTWIATLFVNLNPMMRFDGYYLFSDLIGIPNLQQRAFSLARWRLREAIFGFGEPVTEYFPRPKEKILLIYAYATWIYRFFLFLGIAVLVYYFFFKALGIVLMAVEIIYFIIVPVFMEISEWKKRSGKFVLNRNTVFISACLASIMFFLVFPWQGTVSAPALWKAENYTKIFVPSAAMVDEIMVKPGSMVEAGQEIIRMKSPELDHDIGQIQKKAASLAWQVEFQGVSRDLQEKGRVIRRELEEADADLTAKIREREKLSVKSSISGTVAEIMDPLSTGNWLAENELLAVIINPESGIFEAYVSETYLEQVRPGMTGYFYPDDPGRNRIYARVKSVDRVSARILPDMYHASVYGGAIAVREHKKNSGHVQFVPEIPVYRMILEPVEKLPGPSVTVRGTVVLDGERKIHAAAIWNKIVSVLIRETGF